MERIPLNAKVYVAGHGGLVGSAILRRLSAAGYTNIVTASRAQLDLRDQAAVNYWFKANRPEYVYLVAGTVGGILANSTRPAEFLYDNLLIHATVVHAAYTYDVSKLLYLGSSCIYPRMANQPMTEDQLLTSELEPTNEPYALAKIAGIKLCDAYRKQYGCNFISAMPTNLYGPNDNFDLESSHVLPALLRRFHEAAAARTSDGSSKGGDGVVTIWGTGTPRREFLHVDDLADACLFLMDHYDEAGHINVGSGVDVSIRELAEMIQRIVAPDTTLQFDPSKPDGTPRKLLDVSRLSRLGWQSKIGLAEGIASTYQWFLDQATVRGATRELVG
jgi:GDP-L-fucose synthase